MRERARLLAKAAETALPKHVDVCVVGGGAAGLVSAITSAERGARVVVIEKDIECGRSILATGNGRCNFANTALDCDLYNDAAYVSEAVGPSWLGDVLGFFDECGLMWVEEAQGRLYPLSRQASSVRNVLTERALRAGVVLACARTVRAVAPTAEGFELEVAQDFEGGSVRTMAAARVILAVGGSAIEQLDAAGLSVLPGRPILCPLACTGPAREALDGRRAHVVARLWRVGNKVAEAAGEVLFRPYGLSGIVIFDLSRHARRGDQITLDLLPGIRPSEAERRARHTLDGILDPIIARELVREAGSREAAITLAKSLPYCVEGPAEASHAQVTRGGLLTSDFDARTLEAKTVRGLFACGEALAVDGPCGGYNLAWAWKSGMVAGTAAAERGCERD